MKPVRSGPILLLLALSLLSPSVARAQMGSAPWDVVITNGAAEARDAANHAAWQTRLARTPDDGTQRAVGVDALRSALSLRTQTITRADLSGLTDVEAHLVRARAHAAQLAEAEALTELLAAEQRLLSLLHVPGASAFYAEVQTSIGLVAIQAGMVALAETAQRRACAIDPSRGVRAAEATPSWVQRANAIAREVATGPIGEVEVSADAAGARVFLDDNPQGSAPITVRAVRGVHLLRVEADGMRAFATLLPFDGGTRPAVHVKLNADPVEAALSKLTAAAAADNRDGVIAALSSLRQQQAPVQSATLLRTGDPRHDRALTTRCTFDGCEPSRRLELDASAVASQHANRQSYGHALDPAGLGRDRTQRDLTWLTAIDPIDRTTARAQEPTAWWQHWYVWTIGAVLVGGVTTIAIVAADRPAEPGLRVIVEP